jgi:hypothetical protein
LLFVYYNFCRVHKSLRVTPAMEVGIADHVWAIAELLGRSSFVKQFLNNRGHARRNLPCVFATTWGWFRGMRNNPIVL